MSREEVAAAIGAVLAVAVVVVGAEFVVRKEVATRKAELARRYTVTLPSGERYSGLQLKDGGLGWRKYQGGGGEVMFVNGPHIAVEETKEVSQ